MQTFPPPLDDLLVVPVLGVPLACVDYDAAEQAVCRLAREARPTAVSACNTHLISVARQDPGFGLTLRAFDLIFPDSTVLKWTMNRRGARLDDRVYGPYFMRHMLEKCGAPWKHFFFGGSEECLQDLKKAALELNPEIVVAGTYSPPFGKWGEADEEEFARQIKESGADFVWVALGGERQERWIIQNQHRFERGVFLAVGDAFRLLAGHGKFAPAWMQRAGLNWFYRMMQEPTRLWKRYFHHNSLYMAQLLASRWEDSRLHEPQAPGRLRVAFLGCRGVPARYAGFETVVQELGARLAARGHEIMVYNRSSYYPEKPSEFLGMQLVYLPTIMRRALETISHTLVSTIHAAFQPHDVIYLCGVGNACFAAILRITGKKIIINVDGIDFKRSKWSGFARWWLFQSERWAIRFSDRVIADNDQVVRHYLNFH
jgi:N-acetylglucosaminyldiphosphoundecaprenol N-acetyl-beta-D-mannosaminyltransferase